MNEIDDGWTGSMDGWMSLMDALQPAFISIRTSSRRVVGERRSSASMGQRPTGAGMWDIPGKVSAIPPLLTSQLHTNPNIHETRQASMGAWRFPRR